MRHASACGGIGSLRVTNRSAGSGGISLGMRGYIRCGAESLGVSICSVRSRKISLCVSIRSVCGSTESLGMRSASRRASTASKCARVYSHRIIIRAADSSYRTNAVAVDQVLESSRRSRRTCRAGFAGSSAGPGRSCRSDFTGCTTGAGRTCRSDFTGCAAGSRRACRSTRPARSRRSRMSGWSGWSGWSGRSGRSRWSGRTFAADNFFTPPAFPDPHTVIGVTCSNIKIIILQG